MKHLKKFEELDFSQTLPVTTKNFLTNYYSCDECDSLWKEFNNESKTCKSCGSDEIEDLPEEEWYEIAKERMSPKELKEIENSRNEEESSVVDLLNTKNNI